MRKTGKKIPTIIQGTSKQWKAQQLVGMLMLIIGAVWWMVTAQSESSSLQSFLVGPVLTVTGLLLYVVGRIMASRYNG